MFEKGSYSTLIKSALISDESVRINGITSQMLEYAPTFEEVSGHIFKLMDGKCWIGHNIKAFDNKHLAAAFRRIAKEPPKPSGTLDTLPWSREQFGKTVANHRLATLGLFVGCGVEKHRAMDDVRMNIEVFMKGCMMSVLQAKVKPFDEEPAKQEKTLVKKLETVVASVAVENTEKKEEREEEDEEVFIPFQSSTPSPRDEIAPPVWSPDQDFFKGPNSSPKEQQEIIEVLQSAISSRSTVWIKCGSIDSPYKALRPHQISEDETYFNAKLTGEAEDVVLIKIGDVYKVSLTSPHYQEKKHRVTLLYLLSLFTLTVDVKGNEIKVSKPPQSKRKQ